MLPQIDLTSYPEHARRTAPWHRGESNGGCWLCGFAHVGKAPKHLAFEAGTFTVVDPSLATEDAVDGGSVWVHPIGSTCLKNHPELKPYVCEAPHE
jgi:hypothetical protein